MTTTEQPASTDSPRNHLGGIVAVLLLGFGLALIVGFGLGTRRAALPNAAPVGAARLDSARSAPPTVGPAVPVVEAVEIDPTPSPDDTSSPESGPSSSGSTGPVLTAAAPPSARTVTAVSIPDRQGLVVLDATNPSYSGVTPEAVAALDAAGTSSGSSGTPGTSAAPGRATGSAPSGDPAPAGSNPYFESGGGSASTTGSLVKFDDLCVGGQLSGCPAGIEGTILAEGWAPPMQFIHVSYTADHPLTAECAGERRSFPGQAVLEFVTNNPGNFVVSGGVTVSLTTPLAATRQWTADQGRGAPITTCVAVSHPPTTIRLHVVATDPNGSSATFDETRTIESASNRPPVLIRPHGLTGLRIVLPVTPQEETALLVHNADNGADANPCAVGGSNIVPTELRRLPLDVNSLASAYDRSYTQQSEMTMVAPAIESDICILAVRTESVGVSFVSFAQSYRIAPPSMYAIDAEITAVKPIRGPHPSGPLSVELKRAPGYPRCSVTADAASYPETNAGRVADAAMWGGSPLCQLHFGEAADFVELSASFNGQYHEIAVPVPARACVTLPGGGLYCPVVSPDQLVAIPISVDANVYVHLHLVAPLGRRADWGIGEARDRLSQPGTSPGARPRPDYPVLDLRNSAVFAATGRLGESQLVVRWNADRPVDVTMWIDDYDHATCGRPSSAHDYQTRAGVVRLVDEALGDQGSYTFTGLCAGTNYQIALELVDARGNVSRYSMSHPGVTRRGDALAGNTTPTEVLYGVKVSLAEVPAAWHGQYLRVLYLSGNTPGSTGWRTSRRDSREPAVHGPTTDWTWALCSPVDDYLSPGGGEGNLLADSPGQESTAAFGTLEHRVTRNRAKWSTDVSFTMGMHAYLSATPCGQEVSSREVESAATANFIWFNRFNGRAPVAVSDQSPFPWDDANAGTVLVSSPSVPGLTFGLRVFATRADFVAPAH